MSTRRGRRGPGRNEPCGCGSGRKSKRCCRAGGGARGEEGQAPDLPWTMGGWAPLLPPGALDPSESGHPPPLAELGIDAGAELRVFEVVEVVDGLGYRVAEVGEGPAGIRWVQDPDGSWVAARGTLFAGRFADDTSIRMPDHPDCPLCQAERDRRMTEATRTRAM